MPARVDHNSASCQALCAFWMTLKVVRASTFDLDLLCVSLHRSTTKRSIISTRRKSWQRFQVDCSAIELVGSSFRQNRAMRRIFSPLTEKVPILEEKMFWIFLVCQLRRSDKCYYVPYGVPTSSGKLIVLRICRNHILACCRGAPACPRGPINFGFVPMVLYKPHMIWTFLYFRSFWFSFTATMNTSNCSPCLH